MKPDFFQNLPSEIMTNILSRLPLRTVLISKCVCKAWLDLLESDYFAKSHLSKTKTPPALALLISARRSTRCKVFELIDEAESHDFDYKPLTDFDFPFGESSMEGTAANGLLLLYSKKPKTLYISNPLTRDYVELCRPQESIHILPYRYSCGFGVSKISGKHKVVCISISLTAEFGCDHAHVYTLETGTWRRVEAGASFGYGFIRSGHSVCNFGKFVNGNLHWTVLDSNCTRRICGFDVETESFSIFSLPLSDGDVQLPLYGDLSVLRDCLCVCCAIWREGIVIWLMKEYGVKESWSKEYVISESWSMKYVMSCNSHRRVHLYPIKIFKNGDVLILYDDKLLVCYSKKTRTIHEVGIYDAVARKNDIYATIFTPSLLSLKSLELRT